MIKINLLPFRAARNKELITKQIGVFIGTMCVIAALLVVGNSWLKNRVNHEQVAVNNIKKEVARYEAITKEINKIKSQLDLLQKKTGVIDNLEQSRRDAVHMMETMSDHIVEGRMWLTAIETRLTERKAQTPQNTQRGKAKTKNQPPPIALPPLKSVSLQGLALDNKTVADFMTRLEKIKSKKLEHEDSMLFSKVKLNTLKQHRLDDNVNLKQFNLELTEALPKTQTPNTKASQ